MACANTAEEELRPALGPGLAREICEVEFPVLAADSVVIGVASVEYAQELVLASAGDGHVYDDVYPNDTLYHWQEISRAGSKSAFRCENIRGVKLTRGIDGRRSWHFFEGGVLFGVVLDRGDEQTACAVLQQLSEWEGTRGRGLVVRPDVQQFAGGKWVTTEGYQGGIFFEFFQTESDTVELRMRFALSEVVYGAENVRISYDHDSVAEGVPIVIAKPRDGYWPWDKAAPKFFKVFSADTVSASQWYCISYARGKGSYTFSLDVTPAEAGRRSGIRQGLLFKGTAKARIRGLNPACIKDELWPAPVKGGIGNLPIDR